MNYNSIVYYNVKKINKSNLKVYYDSAEEPRVSMNDMSMSRLPVMPGEISFK